MSPERRKSSRERQLWFELIRRLQAALPNGIDDAKAPTVAAVLKKDLQVKRLFDRVVATAFFERGFLRDQLEDRDGPAPVFSVLGVDHDCRPIHIDIRDAFSFLVDSSGEQVQISLLDPNGEEFALASGPLVGFPDAAQRDGQRIGELTVGNEGFAAVIRIPDDPGTECMMAPDGTVMGKLQNDSIWVVFYPDSMRY